MRSTPTSNNAISSFPLRSPAYAGTTAAPRLVFNRANKQTTPLTLFAQLNSKPGLVHNSNQTNPSKPTIAGAIRRITIVQVTTASASSRRDPLRVPVWIARRRRRQYWPQHWRRCPSSCMGAGSAICVEQRGSLPVAFQSHR